MAQIFDFQIPDALTGDEKSIELIRMLLKETPEPLSRHQFTPGHLTATALVLHRDTQSIALVQHARLKRWLLPGGHIEPSDPTIQSAAAREVLEETGLQVEGGNIIGADVHGIPSKRKDGIEVEPYHLHHDILIGFRALTSELVISEESTALAWASPAQFDRYDLPPNIRRAYARAIAAQY